MQSVGHLRFRMVICFCRIACSQVSLWYERPPSEFVTAYSR